MDIALAKKIALLVFFLFFVGVLLRLVLSKRAKYDEAARIPLDDDVVVTPRNGRTTEMKDANHG